jgi:hypothetical protein
MNLPLKNKYYGRFALQTSWFAAQGSAARVGAHILLKEASSGARGRGSQHKRIRAQSTTNNVRHHAFEMLDLFGLQPESQRMTNTCNSGQAAITWEGAPLH